MEHQSKGLNHVLFAQFFSALADNALLFAAIAMLKSSNAPEWQMPMLQEFFIIAFILLAPFVGAFADMWPKTKVMLVANIIKLAGALSMILGAPPLIAYGIVGIGAAAYSPAKYGILSQIVPLDKMVKANSLMEGSTIVAILLGAVLGGMLADWSIEGALFCIVACYAVASMLNMATPHVPAENNNLKLNFIGLIKNFGHAVKTLLKNKDARFSLIGTSVFWGSGSTLRFLLVAWVPVALAIHDNSTAANLSGVVAIGIAFGAAAAAKYVSITTVNRAIPAGVAIGALIMLFASIHSLYAGITILIMIGACGGFYVVPLNALLQEKGHETVGAGNAVAVQNFFENIVMMLMVGAYIVMTKMGISVVASAQIFGGIVFTSIGLLALMRLKK